MADCENNSTEFTITYKSHKSGCSSVRKTERSRLLPPNAGVSHVTKSDLVSYEDLLVHQYLESLRHEKTKRQHDKHILVSPYLQRLSHSHHVTGRYRPVSATVSGCQTSPGKPKIDAKFIADYSLWDPATPREAKPRRPVSAPVRHSRPQSAVSQRSRVSRTRYWKPPPVIKANAFINGCKDKFIHVAAPNMKTFLESATEKLRLPFAARRMFTEDGLEIFSEKEIPPDGIVYISMGEKFKDPYHATKLAMIIRNKSVWNLKGVVLPENGRRKGIKTLMSKRMRALCENKKVRIMIYRNGHSSSPCEVVADLKNIEDFFKSCTARLDLRSCAKIAYDWNGNEVTDLANTPVLDDSIMHQGKTLLLGPLWISTGEGFSPLGAQSFLRMMQDALKSKIRKAKQHKQNIDFALDNEREKITDTEILSMSVDELYEASEKTDEEIDKYKESLAHISKKLEALQEEVLKEEVEGMKYRISHIQEISADNRLVGTRGCKLKVFENGKADGAFNYFFNIREALKGLDNNNSKEKLMQRLLDELSNSRFSAGASRNLNAVATKLYDKNGCEITDVSTLEQQQAKLLKDNDEQPEISVWLSFGEPYICPFTYAVHLFLDKVTSGHDENGDPKIVRQVLAQEDEHLVRESSMWKTVTEPPGLYETHAQSSARSHYLLHKENQDLILYPEIGIAEKLTCRNQLFVYTESGHIYCKAAPQLCLAVTNARVNERLLCKDLSIDGFAVCMQSRLSSNPCQVWRCTPDATIYCEAYPNLLLTCLGNKRGNDDDAVQNTFTTLFVVADPLPKSARSPQRFAFKQESFHNIGQWKKTEHSNPEWNKLAFSWPVRANGELNRDYDWPMEGFIMPYAPPLQKAENRQGLCGVTPLRLRVLRNFEANEDLAIAVVAPNLTNTSKNNARKGTSRKQNKNKKQQIIAEDYADNDLDRMDMTKAEAEFQMFLASCTSLLNLPLAGRRLFDSSGNELFTINNLKRDTLVYVSCGEDWAGTNASSMEQKRRLLLSQLASDVARIQRYCSLRKAENLVLEVNGPLAPKSGLIVNQVWPHVVGSVHDGGDGSDSKKSADQPLSRSVENTSTDLMYTSQLTAHERAHLESEERLNSLKWPWERLVNVTGSVDMDDPEANKYTDKDLYEKFKPRPVTRISHDLLQKFEYADEHITLIADRTLVLSVSEAEGRVVGVILAKRQPDDLNQRWLVKENGEIRARHNQNMVLTVSMPASSSDNHSSLSFSECLVTLQTRCSNSYGKANQIWRYDAETGLIHAFQSDTLDKEITAANKTDICTYAIAQAADIDQPGYQLEIEGKKLNVCISCARALRGRYKVQRLPPNTSFHCAMGDAKKLKIHRVGSFKVLNNKVDLSTYEAEVSLQYWTAMLCDLKQQTSVQTIMKTINAARTVLTVKVMAYKNGEGRLRKGELICGSSVDGILGQCNHRLGMNSAARRIYLEDGSVVHDVDDLIRFAVENCKTEMISAVLVQKAECSGQNNNRVDEKEQDEAGRFQHLQMAASKEVNEGLRRSFEFMEKAAADHEYGKREDTTVHNEMQEKEEQQHSDSLIQKDEEKRIQHEREQILENIKLPPLEVILRAPIEVWVSSGKTFVSPDVVESKEENERKKRQFRSQVCLALDIEKHVLRQMKGRRVEQMSPGVYRSTLSSKQPVVIEKHWKHPTVEEQDKQLSVDKLQAHLGEIRANQQEGKVNFTGINLNGKLYSQPNLKRVLVYPVEATPDRSVYVWGSTVQEILDSATLKLGMWRQASILYNLDGQKIECLEDVQRDQLLCVSSGKPFTSPCIQKVNTEVKATWGRARRLYGKCATDIIVDVQKNCEVHVDPFGPPLLALPETPDKNVSECSKS